MILPIALRRLMWLRTRGTVRRLFVTGPKKRLVFTIIGAIAFIGWMAMIILGQFVTGGHAVPNATEKAMEVIPLLMLGLLVMTILTGGDERALAFSPAEVDMLFPGPFSRRQLIAYKLTRVVFAAALSSLVFSIFLHRFSASWATAFLGSIFALIFINVTGLALNIIRHAVAERLYGRAKLLLGLLLLAVVAWVITGFGDASMAATERLALVRSSIAGKVALAPFYPFASLYTAESFAQIAGWTLACSAIIASILAAIVPADRLHAEAALAASQNMQRRLERARRGSFANRDPNKSSKALEFTALRALGPFSAIPRRHLILAFRSAQGWLLASAGLGVYAAIFASYTGPEMGAIVLVQTGVMALLMLPAIVRFDFRSDLDQMELLKSLPIRPSLIAAGQLVAPVLICTLVQSIIVLGVGLYTKALDPIYFAPILAALPLINIMAFALENIIFLLLPTRAFAPGQGFQLSGRRLLMMIARLVVLTLGGGLIFLGFYLGNLINGPVTGYGVAWVVSACIAATLIGVVGWAFARFDVSSDMPPE